MLEMLKVLSKEEAALPFAPYHHLHSLCLEVGTAALGRGPAH